MKDDTLVYLLLFGAAGAAVYFAYKAGQGKSAPATTPAPGFVGVIPQPAPGQAAQPARPAQPSSAQQVGSAVDQFLGGIGAITGAIGAIGSFFGNLFGAGGAQEQWLLGEKGYTTTPWTTSDPFTPSPQPWWPENEWGGYTNGHGSGYDYSGGYDYTAPVGDYYGWL